MEAWPNRQMCMRGRKLGRTQARVIKYGRSPLLGPFDLGLDSRSSDLARSISLRDIIFDLNLLPNFRRGNSFSPSTRLQFIVSIPCKSCRTLPDGSPWSGPERTLVWIQDGTGKTGLDVRCLPFQPLTVRVAGNLNLAPVLSVTSRTTPPNCTTSSISASRHQCCRGV